MGAGGCDCSKHIYGSVYLLKMHLWMGVEVCDCLKHIHRQVYLSRRHLWVGAIVYSTFMDGCIFLEYIYG